MADIIGTAGNDTLPGTSGDDTINGLGGNDILDGGEGADVVNGGDGDDSITDTDGTDTINAGAGNDSIEIYLDSFMAPGGSVLAGDGDDTVIFSRLQNNYAIDLGAGNDTLEVRRLDSAGSPVGVILGGGQDNIWLRAEIGVNSATYLIVQDFEAGDTGDTIDFDEFFAAFPGTSWVPGTNPFATGHAELRQVGANVELWYHRDGVDGLYSKPVIHFLNQDVANFTAHNMDGFDPFAPSNGPVRVDSDLTIAVGEAIDRVDVTYVPLIGGITYAMAYLYDSGSARWVNNGAVSISDSTGSIFQQLIGIATTTTSSGNANAIIHNAAGGSITVTNSSTFGDYTNSSGLVESYGIYIPVYGPQVRNDGAITITAQAGSAYGITAWLGGSYEPNNLPLINTGTITVSSRDFAYGIQMGYAMAFHNSGTISAVSDTIAVGVEVRHLNGTHVVRNSGAITASVDAASPFASIAVNLHDTGPTTGRGFTFENSGFLEGDYAIRVFETNEGVGTGQNIVNSGLISGAVSLGYGRDIIVNTGTISGQTAMGADNDRYDGGQGRHDGEVLGGLGNDVLLGGAFRDVLFGDGGRDVVMGGAGDDYIEGGAEMDHLDGGAGIDMLSLLYNAVGATVNLTTGTSVDITGSDVALNFENVIGSVHADTIVGNTAENTLYGMGGNDALDGGGRTDVLHGGRGTDQLTGGGGSDIFLFEVGDGADLITDFAAGETIFAYGLSAATTTLAQAGANVLINFGGGDSLTVANASVAQVTAALDYVSGALNIGIIDVPEYSIVSTIDMVTAPGEVFSLSDPIFLGEFPYEATGFTTQRYYDTEIGLFNQGVLEMSYAGNTTAILATAHFPHVINGITGTIRLTTDDHDGSAIFQAEGVWNDGLIEVISTTGNVTAIVDTDEQYQPTQTYYYSFVVNDGTIHVATAGSGSGIGHLPYTTGSVDRIFNSGDIVVEGGTLSAGIDILGEDFYGNPDILVNSGTITVTDTTAVADSAGVLLETTGGFQMWNSGTITGDYAIRRNELTFGSNIDYGYTAQIYNSGTLNGLVDLDRNEDSYVVHFTIVNTGQINGNVTLWVGNDLFDGRLGSLVGSLNGGKGNDILLTGAGAQVLLGGEGNDTLSGGAGADTLTGGLGADVFRFEGGFGAETITDFNVGQGDLIHVRGYANYTSIAQVGGDVVVTFNASNRIILQGQTLANITSAQFVFGVAAIAANVIPLAPDTPIAPTAPVLPPPGALVIPQTGTNAGEVVRGDAADNTVIGHAGNDIMQGYAGADIMLGGAGNDVYYVDNTGDGVVELAGQGTDEVRASVDFVMAINVENLTLSGTATQGIGNAHDNLIRGGAGASTLDGAGGNDTIFARGNADTLRGGEGDDALYGGNGNDFISGEAGDDFINGQIGSDNLNGNDGDDRIFGEDGADVLDGGDGNDFMRGGNQSDLVWGWAGDDTLYGDAGNDELMGGAGRDVMNGGLGRDVFRFADGDFAGLTAATADRIQDFTQGQDVLRFLDVDANGAGAGQGVFVYLGTAAFTNTAGELRTAITGGVTFVYGDTNGDGVADFAIALTGSITLQAADFDLV